MSERLTKAQVHRLIEIRDWVVTDTLPGTGFWKSNRTDRLLQERGLIEVFSATTPVFGHVRMDVLCCRITPAGLSALQDQEKVK
jgi:hypothetical protein